jgi:hypothetical protein
MELPSACGYATESCEYVDQWDRTNLAVEDLPADAKKLSMSGICEAGPGGPRYGGVGRGRGRGRGRGQGRVAMGVYLKTVSFWFQDGAALELGGRDRNAFQKRKCTSIKTLWPSGLRRWLKAPVRKGVGSNPTGVNVVHVQ